MKVKILSSFMVLFLLLAAFGPSVALAAWAYDLSYTTYITYQNIGTATTTALQICLYEDQDDVTPTCVDRPNLAKDASTSVGVGSLITGSFNGTATMASDQPLAATLVQLPPSVSVEPNARNRPMSNGFDAGTEDVLLASVLKKYGNAKQITKFGVQNAGGSAVTVTIRFFGTSATEVHSFSETLQPGAGYQVDANTITQLPNGFIGSAVLDTTGGSIVGSALELDSANYYNKAFEGVGVGDSPIYMPSALCNYDAGGIIQNSYYAIQNTSATNDANITVTWSNGHTVVKNNVHPYTKAVVAGCDGGNADDFIGSATITSSQPVIALGKVSGGGLSTGFIGFASGADKVALPYVRWANNTHWLAGTMQRANIAIQNVGGSTITGNITVKYINPDGTVAGTHTITEDIPVGGKVNSNPTSAGLTEFGCQNGCTEYGGGAVIQGPAGTQLAVIARLTSYVPASGARVGEDTSGIPYP